MDDKNTENIASDVVDDEMTFDDYAKKIINLSKSENISVDDAIKISNAYSTVVKDASSNFLGILFHETFDTLATSICNYLDSMSYSDDDYDDEYDDDDYYDDEDDYFGDDDDVSPDQVSLDDILRCKNVAEEEKLPLDDSMDPPY